MEAILSSMVHIPRELIPAGRIERMKELLTITPVSFGTYGNQPAPIESFLLTDSHLLAPVQWGLDYCNRMQIPVIDELTFGKAIMVPRMPDPFHPKAPAGQKAFFDDVVTAMSNHCVVVACSGTGTGKTATGFHAIGTFQRAALVIVHSKEIASQWRDKEAPKHLGIDPSDIGIVEEKHCIFQDKPITVAVIHNIIQKKFSPDFYHNFGTVIWDEGHKLGAPGFNESTRYFPAKRKLVLTATPRRKDGCWPLVTNYFGPVRVLSETTPLDCDVQAIPYVHKKNYPAAMPRARMLNVLAVLEDRNQMMIDIIYAMYKAGRNFIGLSDRISQLQTILEKLHEKGVPEHHLALYTRSYVDGQNKTKQTTKDELEFYRDNARIFLATPQMAKEGLDIPRLDAGMCLMPMADAEQALGRIARIYPGKPKPIWYMIKDINNQVLLRSYHSCMKQLKSLKHVNIIGAI